MLVGWLVHLVWFWFGWLNWFGLVGWFNSPVGWLAWFVGWFGWSVVG